MAFKERKVTLPELALVAGTRLALGVGIGFLTAGYLSEGQRMGAGWALTIVGLISTVPLILEIFGKPTQ